MREGSRLFTCASCLITAACAVTQTADFRIRAIPDAAAKLRPGTALLSDANGQLAIGNVGLALEGFRKALRDQPNSADAYSGIARCYEEMGRFDLARSNYEAALALAPKDPQLLISVATSMDQEGNTQDATAARQEAAAISAAQPQIVGVANPIAAPALNATVTIALPPARPVNSMNASRSTISVELPPLARLEAPTVTAAEFRLFNGPSPDFPSGHSDCGSSAELKRHGRITARSTSEGT